MRGSYYESDSESDFDLGEDEYRYGDSPGYIVRMNYDELDLEGMYATALDEYNNRDGKEPSFMMMSEIFYDWNESLSMRLHERSFRPLTYVAYNAISEELNSGFHVDPQHAADACLKATNSVDIVRRAYSGRVYEYHYDYMKVSKLWLHREMLGRSNANLKRELVEAAYHPKKMLAWVMAGNDPEDYLN